MATSAARRIVLASTSKYRKSLLDRFGLAFETASPETDETALPDESPTATAERLALAKARAVRSRFPDALIIGSDQVAHLDGQVFGKPGTTDAAIGQLTRMSGRTVVFDTALCLLDAASGEYCVETVPTRVRFRELVDDEIRRYVDIERPLDCAGSAKSEGLGITLLEALSGDDPTALVGLPLIALARLLPASELTDA